MFACFASLRVGLVTSAATLAGFVAADLLPKRQRTTSLELL